MVQRFLIIFLHIKNVILEQTENHYDKYKVIINSFKAKEIKILEIVVTILQPFLKVTEIMSGQNYATSSLIIHSIYYFRKKLSLKIDCVTSTQLQINLSESLEFYLKKYEL